MDWIKWANEIHENSKAHGWWDEEQTAAEIVCLIHSELSEALEEYRNDRPMVYGLMIQGDEKDTPYLATDMAVIRERGLKPEGIAVELIDAVIRALDYFGECGYRDGKGLEARLDVETRPYMFSKVEFCNMLVEAHRHVSDSGSPTNAVCLDDMEDMIALVWGWIVAQGVDPEAVMRLKHEYNKGRPYRHGGKKL